MRVGVPKEVKPDEYRVGDDAGRRRAAGRGPGTRCSSRPAPASAAGSPTRTTSRPARRSSPTADEVFGTADMIVKVKEPQPAEIGAVPAGADRLHLLPLRRRQGADAGVPGERRSSRSRTRRSRTSKGTLPLLTPMSEIAGQDEHPGGGEVPREADDGPRHPARRRAGRGAGARRRPRRRRRRHERGEGRGGPRGERHASWTSTSTACATSTT